MLLIKPSFTIKSFNGNDILWSIEVAGRTCYKSEDKITQDSSLKFVADIIKRGHESVLEHEKITVRAICDRGVSHEIVRHRIASYSQESTRYCNYGKSDHISFIIPAWLEFPEVEVTNANYTDFGKNEGEISWLVSMLDCEWRYKHLLAVGWKPEQARSVLPNSLKTEIVMTMNLREWRHFFKLRTANTAHPDMRALARPMLDTFKQMLPVVFEDITYTNTDRIPVNEIIVVPYPPNPDSLCKCGHTGIEHNHGKLFPEYVNTGNCTKCECDRFKLDY